MRLGVHPLFSCVLLGAFSLGLGDEAWDTVEDANRTNVGQPSPKSLKEIASRLPMLRQVAGCAKMIHDLQSQKGEGTQKSVTLRRSGKSQPGFLDLQRDILKRRKSGRKKAKSAPGSRRRVKSKWKRQFKKFWKWLRQLRKRRQLRKQQKQQSGQKKPRNRKKSGRKNQQKKQHAHQPGSTPEVSEEEKSQLLRNKELLKETLMNLQSITHV